MTEYHSPDEDEITIRGGKVFEKGKGKGDLLDSDGNVIEEGAVTYRIEMPEHETKKSPPESNN